jgi:acyl-CoA thioesterase I
LPCLRPCRTWRWPSRIKTTIHILAIGSSSTFGIGASTLDRTYPFQLQDILEKTFKGHDIYISNSGTSGELAAATAERVKTEVELKQPDLVLWQVGTNDVLAGVPVEDFRAIVQSTIRWLKERRIDTTLIGLQYSPTVEKGEHHGDWAGDRRDRRSRERPAGPPV